MRLLDELLAPPVTDPDQETEPSKKTKKESGRKYYTFYVALGALKNFGYQVFEMPGGERRTFSELIRRPCVPDAKAKIFYPRRDGTMLDINDNIILTGKE